MVFVEAQTEEQFNTAYAAPKCIVYYTATWCGPCRAIAPEFEKLAQQYPDITFLKVDIDKLNNLQSVKSISSVPTFKMCHNQVVVQEFSGANPGALQKMAAELNKK